jgi:2-polyprenyl-3-methyl-5-hydroxy-6-metoxy-1,4-benzoquinol methylase
MILIGWKKFEATFRGKKSVIESDSYVAVESYRARADETHEAAWNYKGLEMIASPQIHEFASGLIDKLMPKGASVLDLGSGSGAMCLRLQDMGFRPVGCDLVSENFRLHGKVDFLIANINEPLPPELQERFDCIVATELIEHLENPRHFIRQCQKALKPGGLLIVTTPNIGNAISIAQYIRTGEFRWFAQANYHKEGHITPIPISTIKMAFREAGFEGPTIQSISPLSFPGLSWWKMRLLAAIIRAVPGRIKEQGDVLVAWGRRA